MTVVYCEDAPLYVTVKRWAAEFCQGRKSFEGEPRSTQDIRPKLPVRKTVVLWKLVLQNRRVNVHLIADTVGISTGPVKMILREFC